MVRLTHWVSLVGLAAVLAGCASGATPSSSNAPTPESGGAPTPAVVTTPAPSHMPADRYDDGLPREWQGQPVLRWDDALTHRQSVADKAPFLVAGWLNFWKGAHSCPAGGCRLHAVSSEAGSGPPDETTLITFKFSATPPTTGPAIMRVHLHDTRMASCGSTKGVCDQMLVVDDIVWSGDALTAPHPLGVAAVMAATIAADPASRLLDPSEPWSWGCGADLVDGLSMCAPPSTGSEAAVRKVAGAAVMPSSEALTRALPDVQQGVDGAIHQVVQVTGSISGPGYAASWDNRWLVVDNVAILLHTTVGSPSPQDVELMTALVAALKAQEHAPAG